MKLLTTGFLALTLSGLAYSAFGTTTDIPLIRTECAKITVFSPAGKKTAEDICRPYGGVLEKQVWK